MRRRDFITFLGGAAAWPLAARAQQGDRMRRIGVLTLSSSVNDERVLAAFVDGLRSHGYVDGKNLNIDYRYADGDVERLAPLAKELIALNPDVVLAAEPSPAIALKSIAPTMPVVCPLLTDAQVPELAASYARPGGSVTGIAQTVEGLTGKLIELALEFVPEARRVAFLSNPTGASMRFFEQGIVDTARGRGITVLTEQVMTRAALDTAFEHFVEQQAQAVVVPENSLFRNEAVQIAQLAKGARLPAIFGHRYFVEAGGLASYGIDQRESFRRAAEYVDQIFKGARPGDMPIEFPTKVELVINLKTAKALGLDVPLFLQQRADEVIE